MGRSRVESLFGIVRSYAARRLPWIKSVRVKFCSVADDAHRRRWRLFSHSIHEGVYTVCFARTAEWELTDNEILGISAHELGHIIGIREGWPEHRKPQRGRETPKAVQREADQIARRVLGIRIRYNKRRLEELAR